MIRVLSQKIGGEKLYHPSFLSPGPSKKRPAVPHGTERRPGAVPLSSLTFRACNGAHTEGIAPPTPGRTFPRSLRGAALSGVRPLSVGRALGTLSVPRGYFHYITMGRGKCQGRRKIFAWEGALFTLFPLFTGGKMVF